MRLLDTGSLVLHEFPDSVQDDPNLREKYVILSHRWFAKGEEVSFEDLTSDSNVAHKRGYAKLKRFCSQAASLGYKYAWCDTCCINKNGYAELGEAIGSMFRWYRNAEVCIAFLEDVEPGVRELVDSVWFTRGWTLQELIAPPQVSFYDGNWEFLGTRATLGDRLAAITNVPGDVLQGTYNFLDCSVAQRMSWAASRTTERIEDRAYSLIGLFGVSLAINYGEREEAFMRLQRQIIQDSPDQSIFAWELSGEPDSQSGLLAPSPSAFSTCKYIIRTDDASTHRDTSDANPADEAKPFVMTNLGLSIRLLMDPYYMDIYYAYLACADESSNYRYTIYLRRLRVGNQYARVVGKHGKSVSLTPPSLLLGGFCHMRDILVQKTPPIPPSNRAYAMWIRTFEPPRHETSRIVMRSADLCTETDYLSLNPGTVGTAGIVSMAPESVIPNEWSRIRWMKVGFDADFQPVIFIANKSYPLGSQDRNVFSAEDQQSPSLEKPPVFSSKWLRRDELDKQLANARIAPARDIGWGSTGWGTGSYVMRVEGDGTFVKQLESIGVEVRASLLPDLRPAVGSSLQSPTKTTKIWTIDVVAMQWEHSPEVRLKKAQRDATCDWFIACCCSNSGSKTREDANRQMIETGNW